MKLLFAVVMFVLGFLVITAYAQKNETAPGHKADESANPHVTAQENEDCACNPIPFTAPEPSPQGCRPIPATADEEKKEELLILNAGNAIQCELVRVGVGLGAAQLILALVTIWYAGRGVGIADQALKFAERAYVAVENWQYNGVMNPLTCKLLNTGRTPATLGKYDMIVDIRGELPPVPGYKRLPKLDLENLPMGANRDMTLQAAPPVVQLRSALMRATLENPPFTSLRLSSERREELLNLFASSPFPTLPVPLLENILKESTLTLYFYGCIAYHDIFGRCHRVAFCNRFDAQQRIFILVNDRPYNYST